MSAQLDSSVREMIRERAAFWTVRLAVADCSLEDRRACEAWLAEDPRHQAAWEQIQQGEAVVDGLARHPDLQALVRDVQDEAEAAYGARRTWRLRAIAAGLVLFFLTSGALVLHWQSSSLVAPPAFAERPIYETLIGERSTIALSDGSSVTLNTNSRAEIAFSATERAVHLVRGQAFFEIAKDVDRPFVTVAGGHRILALGTKFDVRFDDPEALQVTLVEGRVGVSGGFGPSTGREEFGDGAHDAIIELQPGERLAARLGAVPEVMKADLAEISAWRNGMLVFRDTPLPEVVAEMNRYSTQKLVLADEARLRELRVNGVFKTGRVSSFVAALETMHPLQARRDSFYETVLAWRD